MYTQGQVVFSKSGRDKKKAFVVVAMETSKEGEYLYLADGYLRKIEKPKKKKCKHVQLTKHIAADLQKKLENKEPILNAEIRKVLADACSSSEEVRELVEG